MRTTEKLVLFWTANDLYSNFYFEPFEHNGISFKWSEQAVMYAKAKLFKAPQVILDSILAAETPASCKSIGRSPLIPFDEDVWQVHRERVYYEVLVSKFALPNLREELLTTGDRTLVEASPYDKIWGIGMSAYADGVENPSKWKGLNLLGKVLMRVREDIKDDLAAELVKETEREKK